MFLVSESGSEVSRFLLQFLNLLAEFHFSLLLILGLLAVFCFAYLDVIDHVQEVFDLQDSDHFLAYLLNDLLGQLVHWEVSELFLIDWFSLMRASCSD